MVWASRSVDDWVSACRKGLLKGGGVGGDVRGGKGRLGKNI